MTRWDVISQRNKEALYYMANAREKYILLVVSAPIQQVLEYQYACAMVLLKMLQAHAEQWLSLIADNATKSKYNYRTNTINHLYTYKCAIGIFIKTRKRTHLLYSCTNVSLESFLKDNTLYTFSQN